MSKCYGDWVVVREIKVANSNLDGIMNCTARWPAEENSVCWSLGFKPNPFEQKQSQKFRCKSVE